MAKVDFSVVITVKNEADSIVELLDSLEMQTVKAKEIIVVDGGSVDDTMQQMVGWQKNNTTPLLIVESGGSNRSEGRNLGIGAAKSDYIAITDGGCTAEKDWLRAFAESFEKNEADAVAGFYSTKADTAWRKIFSLYLATHPDDFDESTYLPSSRSIAFTKEAWEKAGKYPAHLNICEDLVFAAKLKDRVEMIVNSEARVVWKMPNDLVEFMRAVGGYATGDVMAGYSPHVGKIFTVYLRYVLFALLPPIFVAYLFYPLYKFWGKTRGLMERVKLPIVQVASDLAVMYGGLRGLLIGARFK